MSPGPLALALTAALLFGASTPASKLLLEDMPPLHLAGLLYLGAAFGVAPVAWRERLRRGPRRPLDRNNRRHLLASVVFGGVAGPVLLLLGLQRAGSASVSLLLNLEMVATAALGVLCFREHLGRFGWAGIAVSLVAGALLGADGGAPGLVASLLVAGACIAWGLDNHATALLDGLTPSEATVWKGCVAGTVNLTLGGLVESADPSGVTIAAALLVGALAYGVSIVLYIVSAQHLGATRAQVAFATAPFLGAALSFLVVGETVGLPHLLSASLLAAGVGLLMLDTHTHEHHHPAEEHVHSHRHDDGHHDHEHQDLPKRTRHTHRHQHAPVTHAHRHLPDIHHRHGHEA